MKKYFLYCKPTVGVKTYIGYIECDFMENYVGIIFFWRDGKIVLSLVADYMEIEDRTEPDE